MSKQFNSKDLKVGDIVIDKDGDERKVLEVLQNSFLLSDYTDLNEAEGWYTFQEARLLGWKIKEDVVDEVKREKVIKEVIELLEHSMYKSSLVERSLALLKTL